MDFSELIKSRRTQVNKTLEEIGKIVGVSKATVQRWESGEIKNVRRDKIAKLAAALETTPAYLMGWDEKPQLQTTLITPSDSSIDTNKEIEKHDTTNDDDIKFALFKGDEGITEEMFDEVRQFAEFVKQREKGKK